jgi:hypothetical protein
MRRHLLLMLLALALAVGATPRAAQAQSLEQPRARQGYWIGLGLLQVVPHLTEKGDSKGFYTGGGFNFRIGQLITERLGLGLLFEYAGLKKGADQGTIGGLTLEGSMTLWRGLSAHTGLGVGFVMVTDDNSKDKELRGGGGSYFLGGLSWDFYPWRKRLTGGWAITPTVDFRAMPDGNIHFYGVFAALQITWWSGLPRNMLILPEE